MLLVEIRVNYKVVRSIGIQNMGSASQISAGVCSYDVYDITNLTNVRQKEYLGNIQHKRSDGAESLAQKALNVVVEHDKNKESGGKNV